MSGIAGLFRLPSDTASEGRRSVEVPRVMKTAVIAFNFPELSETFVLRHIQAFSADVICQEFRPKLLTSREGIGNIEHLSEPRELHKGIIPRLISRACWHAKRLARPDSVFAWDRDMRLLWTRYLDSYRPDVVLAEFAPNALGALPASLERGIPLVAHFHGYDASTLMRFAAYRRALPRMFQEAAAIICVSTQMRDVLVSAGCSAEKLHVIPCGAPVSEFKFSDRTGSQPCRFIAVSRLVPGKGTMTTLRAFHLTHLNRPGVRLIVAGDGPMRREMTSYVRKHSLDRAVSMVGAVPNREVRRLLATSSAFVQASLRDKNGAVEGAPVALAEALATGLPAVVSRCGGMADLVAEGCNGFLFEQGDWRMMAERMLHLADDPALRLRMGRAARERIEEAGSTEKNIEVLRAVLRQAAACGGPQASRI
ncbi:MAG TPA: glycosyltransferase family 4 protein [Bryobacteraceae bacterium]